MKHLLIIGFLIGLAQYSAGQSRLSDNETIQESFTTPEIEDLQMLFDYFNESVCTEQHSDDLNTCYSDFFKRMEQTEESGEFDINISFDRQKGVYKAFKDSTFYRIGLSGIGKNMISANRLNRRAFSKLFFLLTTPSTLIS